MQRRAYPTDLTDAEWLRIVPLLPDESPRGRPRKHPAREIFDAIFYIVSGEAAPGAFCRTTSHRGAPFTTGSGDGAWTGSGNVSW